jgi:hypothetical protein
MYGTLQAREEAPVIAENARKSTRKKDRVHMGSGRV